MESDYSPEMALADAAAARERIAARMVTPRWYHPCLGVLELALCSAFSWPYDGAWYVAKMATILVAAAGIGLLVSRYRRQTGLWIGPAQAGPAARRAWRRHGVVWFSCVVVACLGSFVSWGWIVGLATGLLALVSIMITGPRFDDAMRRDIRAGHATVKETVR